MYQQHQALALAIWQLDFPLVKPPSTIREPRTGSMALQLSLGMRCPAEFLDETHMQSQTEGTWGNYRNLMELKHDSAWERYFNYIGSTMEQVGSKKLHVLYFSCEMFPLKQRFQASASALWCAMNGRIRWKHWLELWWTLAQHGSGIVLLRQSHVAICCYQIMSYMIYMSYQINMFFRIFSRPGTPWSRSHDGWVGFWSTTSCQGLWMTPVLAAIECNPALGAVEHQCQAHTISGQNISKHSGLSQVELPWF